MNSDPRVGRSKRLVSSVGKGAISLGQNPVGGHRGSKQAALLSAEHCWPDRKPAPERYRSVELLDCARKPVENRDSRSGMSRKVIQDGINGTPAVNRHDPPSRRVHHFEDRSEDVALVRLTSSIATAVQADLTDISRVRQQGFEQGEVGTPL